MTAALDAICQRAPARRRARLLLRHGALRDAAAARSTSRWCSISSTWTPQKWRDMAAASTRAAVVDLPARSGNAGRLRSARRALRAVTCAGRQRRAKPLSPARLRPGATCRCCRTASSSIGCGRPVRRAHAPRVVFCGVMNYAPNDEGMTWFVENVWPRRARRSAPTRRSRSSGRIRHRRSARSARRIRRSRSPAASPTCANGCGIRRSGLRRCMSPRGVQNKALEAIAAGLPIVITDAVAGGLPRAAMSAVARREHAARIRRRGRRCCSGRPRSAALSQRRAT